MLSIKMGTVTGYEIGTLLNIENVQILQVTIENDQDATPAILINPAMDESTPKTGDRVMIIKIGNFSLAIGGIDGIEPITAEGEKRLYSRDSGGDISASITLQADGKIVIGNQVQQLKTLFNSLLDEIIAIKTVGSPPQHNLSPDSIANFTQIKLDFDGLWG